MSIRPSTPDEITHCEQANRWPRDSATAHTVTIGGARVVIVGEFALLPSGLDSTSVIGECGACEKKKLLVTDAGVCADCYGLDWQLP